MDARIAALTVALLSVCVAPMPEARAQSRACNPPPGQFDPTKPASAGFNLVFSDDFTNPQTIDLNTTGNAGFNWYLTKFFGYGTEPASAIAFTQDGLTLTPTSLTGSYDIATAAPANNTQVGNAFGGWAYFEAKIKFDPTTVNFSQGFPAFWGFSIEHAANMGADHPAGTPTGFQHFIEDDFFEFDISWASSIAYGTAIHDWYGIYYSTCREGYLSGSPGFCDVTNNWVGTPYSNFVSTKQNNVTIDWTQWHTIGQLWLPGSRYNRELGYVQNFIDGQPAYAGNGNFNPLSKTGWKDVASAYIDPINSPTAFSVLDRDHLMIILGSGLGQPFTVGYVKVWQIPGCAK